MITQVLLEGIKHLNNQMEITYTESIKTQNICITNKTSSSHFYPNLNPHNGTLLQIPYLSFSSPSTASIHLQFCNKQTKDNCCWQEDQKLRLYQAIIPLTGSSMASNTRMSIFALRKWSFIKRS